MRPSEATLEEVGSNEPQALTFDTYFSVRRVAQSPSFGYLNFSRCAPEKMLVPLITYLPLLPNSKGL